LIPIPYSSCFDLIDDRNMMVFLARFREHAGLLFIYSGFAVVSFIHVQVPIRYHYSNLLIDTHHFELIDKET